MKRNATVTAVVIRVNIDRGNASTFLAYTEDMDGRQVEVAEGEVGPFDSWVDVLRPLVKAVVALCGGSS